MQNTSLSSLELVRRGFISKVYGWMAAALMITALVSMWTAMTPALFHIIAGNQILFILLLVAEVGLVFYLSARIHKMSVAQAHVSFIAYSILNGLTLSIIFMVYTQASLATTFFVTAGTFGAMSLYGFTTKTDLTSLGNLCFMALIGIILASVVNMFFASPALYLITTYVGILIFVGLTAYDTQKLKIMSQTLDEASDEGKKAAIMGALALYLDFINLFLMLMRIFGRRR